jgi:hypothetical protein
MKYLKFTHVDALTGISVAAEPPLHGTQFPAVAGLDFVWARESAYPTLVPELFGTCPDASDTQIDGVLELYTEADFAQMQADELALCDTTPKVSTMRQARLALLGAGLLPSVDATIAAMTGAEGDAARIEWEYAQEVRRDSPLMSGMVTALGLTSAQVDALFETAARL